MDASSAALQRQQQVAGDVCGSIARLKRTQQREKLAHSYALPTKSTIVNTKLMLPPE